MSDNPVLQEDSLTWRTHLDPAKHYIGEALTPPSIDDITFSGVETATGESPFAARADHSHDSRARFSGMSSSSATIIPAGGSAYINNLTVPWGTENFLHAGSTQLVDFPQEGAYRFWMLFQINRSTGVFPANIKYEIRWDFDNATNNILSKSVNTAEGYTFLIDTTDVIYYLGAVLSSSNVQIIVFNHDSVNWSFTASEYEVHRKHSSLGAQT